MRPGATDLLKAYHLRAIGGSDSLRLQSTCAKRWEDLQKDLIPDSKADFAPVLFHQFLWRARRWTGREVTAREKDDDIITEFQERSIDPEVPDKVLLYPSPRNRLSTLKLLPQGDYSIVGPTMPMSSNRPADLRPEDLPDLPFTIRQPISKGIGFFFYAAKYAALVKQLLDEEHPDPQVRAFNTLYREVITKISTRPYLRELFLLASVMYVDQFKHDNEHNKLLEFALWLDHVLGAIRLEKKSIREEAPINFLRDATHNLLDVIASAYRPDEVIVHLKNDRGADNIYEEDQNIEIGSGIQDRYKESVLKYYGKLEYHGKKKRGSLKGKSQWITQDFINGKLEQESLKGKSY